MKQVFISYRSSNGGAEMARLLKEKLEANYKVSAFMDVTNLQSGRFDEQLLEKIKNCNSMVLALAPGSLEHCAEEDDWVRIEIEYALEHHKTIIPVFAEGFIYPKKGQVPNSIYEALQYQGVQFNKQYLDATIQKIAEYIKTPAICFCNNKRRCHLVAGSLLILLSIIVLAAIRQNKLVNYRPPSFDAAFNDHLVIAWENANHQYAQGLNSWKRLDYTRAESDMLAALEGISAQASQSEVEVATVNNSLGCLYLDMGKYEAAYDYLNSAYVAFKKAYGSKSMEARAVQFSIAQHDYYTGDNATALKMCEAILNETDPNRERIVVTAVKYFKASVL